MSKIDTLKLDEAEVSDGDCELVTILTMMAGHEYQEIVLDVGEARKLRDWLTKWLETAPSS